MALATKGEMHFQRPQGGCKGFSRQRRYKKWRRRRRTSPAQRYYIPPEGGALNPSGRRQPVPDRTLGAQGQRPGGAINPHARKGVSTFGNTGKHRPGPSPDPDRATGAHFHPLNPGHPVAPMGDTTTLGPTGPIKLKNLFPQPFYTTHGGAVPLRAQQARPSHALASTRKISPARKKRI